MKTISFLLLLVMVIISCCNPSAKKKPKETFEGSIQYNITYDYKTKSGGYMCLFQHKRFGSIMNMYISKNGDLKREFPNCGFRGLSSHLFKADSAKNYNSWLPDIGLNTGLVYSSSSKINSLKFISQKELTGQKINGYNCKSYFISGVDLKNKQVISLTYFYPEDKEYINPDLYKNCKDFFYDTVIAKMKAPYYKLIMNMGSYSMTIAMINIDSHPLSPSIFSTPEDAIEQ